MIAMTVNEAVKFIICTLESLQADNVHGDLVYLIRDVKEIEAGKYGDRSMKFETCVVDDPHITSLLCVRRILQGLSELFWENANLPPPEEMDDHWALEEEPQEVMEKYLDERTMYFMIEDIINDVDNIYLELCSKANLKE